MIEASTDRAALESPSTIWLTRGWMINCSSGTLIPMFCVGSAQYPTWRPKLPATAWAAWAYRAREANGPSEPYPAACT